VCDRSIRITGNLADQIDHVHPPSINSLVHPESHDIINGLSDVDLFPIEIRLFSHEQVKIPFVGLFIVLPSRTRAEDALPVVGRQLFAVWTGLSLLPVEPLALGVVEGRPGFLEPCVLKPSKKDVSQVKTLHFTNYPYLAGAMVDDKIVDELDAVLMTCFEHLIPVFHRSIGFMKSSSCYAKVKSQPYGVPSQNMHAGYALVIADIVSLQTAPHVQVDQ
jgi:hypothetical protein